MARTKRTSSPPLAAHAAPGQTHSPLDSVRALPHGMRDLLPREATRLAAVGRQIAECFELFGYQLVTLPSFEYSELLERALDGSTVLRFVEPETGEIVAFRPDMTPQVARLVAHQLAQAPPPARLFYHGSVLRRRHERARRRREVTQAGFELIGSSGIGGDREVLEVLIAAAEACGLREFTVGLAHAGVTGTLLALLEPEQRSRVREALVAKDSSELVRQLAEAELPQECRRALEALPLLHGGAEIWPEARRLLVGTVAEPYFSELEQLWSEARASGHEQHLLLDFGEPPSFDYYTGPVYELYAAGPGEPIGAGGRYDRLLERYGMPEPAAGFAFDLGNVCWALATAHAVTEAKPRVLVGSSEESAAVVRELLGCLRHANLPCTAIAETIAEEYAASWRFSHTLAFTATGARVRSVGREPGTISDVSWDRRREDVASLAGRVVDILRRLA